MQSCIAKLKYVDSHCVINEKETHSELFRAFIHSFLREKLLKLLVFTVL